MALFYSHQLNRVNSRNDLAMTALTSDICLSVAYIGPKSRTERPRKTKIGTEVAHVTLTRTPLSRSKGQRSTCRGRAYCGGLPHSLLLLLLRGTSTKYYVFSSKLAVSVWRVVYLKGMDYLHNTSVGSHGHLTSRACVVDSRYSCKISDYGMNWLRNRYSHPATDRDDAYGKNLEFRLLHYKSNQITFICFSSLYS